MMKFWWVMVLPGGFKTSNFHVILWNKSLRIPIPMNKLNIQNYSFVTSITNHRDSLASLEVLQNVIVLPCHLTLVGRGPVGDEGIAKEEKPKKSYLISYFQNWVT